MGRTGPTEDGLGRRAKRLFLVLGVFVLSTIFSWGEQRFPPPDFESGYKLPLSTAPAPRSAALEYVDVAVLLIALGTAAYCIFRSRSRRGVMAVSLFSLAYFGFYRKGCICAIGSVQNVALSLASSAYALPLSVLLFFLAPLVVSLFAGRTFCAAVCPHGALQDLVLWKPLKVPPWLEESLGLIPYLYLGAGVAFAATGSAFVICRLDPFVPLFRLSGSVTMLLLGAGFVGASLFVGRPYCRFLCPYGALLKLAAKVSKWRVTITPNHCVQCRLCEESCPYGALREPVAPVPVPVGLAGDRRRLTALVLLAPLLIAGAGWLGSGISLTASRIDPTVALAERLVGQQARPAALAAQTAPALALARASQDPKAMLKSGLEVQQRFSRAGWAFGLWAGVVVCVKLVGLGLRQKRTDYEPDRGACLECARCFDSCPNERVRKTAWKAASAPLLTSAAGPFQVGWRRLAGGMAWISAAFCLFVCLVLIGQSLRMKAEDPLKSRRLTALKEQLLAHPKDEPLKQRIRDLDLQLRRRYFQHLMLNGTGAWLALGGALAWLMATKAGNRQGPEILLPAVRPNALLEQARSRTWARWSVAAFGVITAVGFVSLAVGSRSSLSRNPAELDRWLSGQTVGPRVQPDFASEEEMHRNWPRFRGPDGNGVATATNLPLTWDVKSGAGTGWKSEALVHGFNSPIVWGDRLFLSGGDAKQREVLCFDARHGGLLWRQIVASGTPTGPVHPEIPEQTGYAASTMATDGRRLYAIFANGDLASLTLDGQPVWTKNLGWPKNPYGHASSLAVGQGRLFVQLDQGEADQNASRLFAFEGATGQVIWQRPRPVSASWATPLLIGTGEKKLIVTVSAPWVVGYSVQDGTEIWRADGLAGEVTPSPIFAQGLIFVVSPNEKLLAVRPDGQGDVTKTHLAWSAEDNVPDISSPTSFGEWVFTASTAGMITCYHAQTGQKKWEHDLGMETHPSLSVADGRLYVVGTKGMTVVAEAGPAYRELARADFGENIHASPAFAANRMFVRGATHLFCVTATETQVASEK